MSVLYFVVRVRCHRKESSHSLSNLLMSLLYSMVLLKAVLSVRPSCSKTTPVWFKILKYISHRNDIAMSSFLRPDFIVLSLGVHLE